MSTISIDYDKAYAEANRLQSIAGDCENTVNQSKRLTAEIPGYWQGASASEFAARNDGWNREMQAIKNELLSISRQITKVADEIREADRRAAEAIRQKTEAQAAKQ